MEDFKKQFNGFKFDIANLNKQSRLLNPSTVFNTLKAALNNYPKINNSLNLNRIFEQLTLTHSAHSIPHRKKIQKGGEDAHIVLDKY
jgi:hypothetical protein